MKIAVILAFSLCLIAYSTADEPKVGCCKDKACSELNDACADTTHTCKITYGTDGVGEKGECDARLAGKEGDCDDATTCWCAPAELVPAKACQEKPRSGLEPPVAPKSCCADTECKTPTACADDDTFCSWETTGGDVMTGGKCAKAGEDKKCSANTAAGTCTCGIKDKEIPCNFGFKRDNWEPAVEAGTSTTTGGATGETSSKGASGPTTPSDPDETTVNGSASVRTTILTTVYPLITILGVALLSFSPA